MKRFYISGRLPAPWEDFYDEDEKTNITILGNEKNDCFIETCPMDNWTDIFLKDKMITNETAIAAMSLFLNIPENEIEIIENKICQSV